MNSSRNIEQHLQDFETKYRKFENALNHVGQQLKQLSAQDLMNSTSSPYLFAAEAVALGFYLREKTIRLSRSEEPDGLEDIEKVKQP